MIFFWIFHFFWVQIWAKICPQEGLRGGQKKPKTFSPRARAGGDGGLSRPPRAPPRRGLSPPGPLPGNPGPKGPRYEKNLPLFNEKWEIWPPMKKKKSCCHGLRMVQFSEKINKNNLPKVDLGDLGDLGDQGLD